MKFLTAAAAAALLTTAACTGDDMAAQSPGMSAPMAGDPAMAAAATPTDAMGFVAAAGASDLYETQSSQIALQKSQNGAVRDYAQMMISDHARTTRDVTAAATAAGMSPPPPMLMPMQSDMIAQLQPLSGAEFDRTYLQQQLQSHQMALALHSNYAKSGDTPALRGAAAKAVPIVRRHLSHVQQLAKA